MLTEEDLKTVAEAMSSMIPAIMENTTELAYRYSEKCTEMVCEQVRALLRVVMVLNPTVDVKKMFLEFYDEERKNREQETNDKK